MASGKSFQGLLNILIKVNLILIGLNGKFLKGFLRICAISYFLEKIHIGVEKRTLFNFRLHRIFFEILIENLRFSLKPETNCIAFRSPWIGFVQ